MVGQILSNNNKSAIKNFQKLFTISTRAESEILERASSPIVAVIIGKTRIQCVSGGVVALEARNEGDERHESLHVDGSSCFLSPRIRESRGMMSKNGTSISLSQMMVRSMSKPGPILLHYFSSIFQQTNSIFFS
jgi:hypothetical protein